MSNKANGTQVGGSHYRTHGSEIQHWDLAVMYQWDPFQYQITKYIMRWKHKHTTRAERLKDLHKAAHFLQKYIEEAAQYDSPAAPARALPAQPATVSAHEDWAIEGFYGDMTQHYRCRHCGDMVRAASYAAADDMHGACPRPRGYVDQDR